MNKISIKQNEQKQLERLAAQREIYSFAKKLHLVQIILTVFLPIAFFIISSIYTSFIAYSALFGILAFVVDGVFITPLIKNQKNKAAKIQELFDCEVLELDKSPLKVATDVSVEEILLNYNAHKKIAANIENIRDWYPTNITDLPISIARIICQRANCWWDSTLRIRYSNFLKYFAIVVLLSIFIVSFFNKSEVTELTLFLSGLIPFFQFCNKESFEHHDAAERLNELVQYSESIWQEAINTPEDYHRNKLNSRRLQDEIFEHRSKSPLILDKFYNLFRDQNEVLMNRTSEILIEEAKEKINKSR
ncbi:S-4TM family putative pore-forming effector [Dokdonia ponticola]|uniref:S-4TM family putative pore-forming effector n=1 Tax=Dokdonia ponticola TaxID=2041041 RepID=A0ABV9HYT9_9FLAO